MAGDPVCSVHGFATCSCASDRPSELYEWALGKLHQERLKGDRLANARMWKSEHGTYFITHDSLNRLDAETLTEWAGTPGNVVRIESGNPVPSESDPDALSALTDSMRESAQDTLAALERRGWAVVRK